MQSRLPLAVEEGACCGQGTNGWCFALCSPAVECSDLHCVWENRLPCGGWTPLHLLESQVSCNLLPHMITSYPHNPELSGNCFPTGSWQCSHPCPWLRHTEVQRTVPSWQVMNFSTDLLQSHLLFFCTQRLRQFVPMRSQIPSPPSAPPPLLSFSGGGGGSLGQNQNFVARRQVSCQSLASTHFCQACCQKGQTTTQRCCQEHCCGMW